jgi:hypothetical protein
VTDIESAGDIGTAVRLDKVMRVLNALGLHLQLARQGDPAE